jgi:hypothetical protein
MDQSSPEEYDFLMYLNIDQVRLLYSHVCYSIEVWPGSPARPAVEQEYLHHLKTQLFAMLADHSFTELDIDR